MQHLTLSTRLRVSPVRVESLVPSLPRIVASSPLGMKCPLFDPRGHNHITEYGRIKANVP